jgi:hypothetical protein
VSALTKKQRKPRSQIEIKSIDVLATIIDELAEAVALMRPYFPDDDEATLCGRAMALRAERYRIGRWPDFSEVANAEPPRKQSEVWWSCRIH